MTEAAQPAARVPVLRHASRIIVLDDTDRVLLFRAKGSFDIEGTPVTSLWFAPGGGKEGDETPEATAVRELWEETGLRGVELSACVWQRALVFTWNDGRLWDARESYFVCRAPSFEPDPANWTAEERADLAEHRWWSLDEIEASSERFAPRALAALLRPILGGDLPQIPLLLGQ